MQVFSNIQTSKTVLELVKNKMDICKQNQISIMTKYTRIEFTKRVRFLVRLIFQYSTILQYNNQIKKEYRFEDGIIKLR